MSYMLLLTHLQVAALLAMLGCFVIARALDEMQR